MTEKPDDPAMTAYEAVRAHELTLNEAVSRFEHARLAPLIVLNGGAVVAFLTLLGALLSKGSGRHPDLWLSGLAAGAWVVGLVAAALSIAAAASQQAAISAAHRLLREALEEELIDDKRDVAKVLQGPRPGVSPPPPRALTHPVQRAQHAWKGIEQWWSAAATPKAAKKRSDAWDPEKSKRQEERLEVRADLREIAGAYAQRFKARWWLSVTMFVTGAALALAAVLSGDHVS